MTVYKRGDVVLAIFPNSDRITFKKRPVLVVQNESVPTFLGQTIVAPITSNQGRVSPAMLPVKAGSPEHKSMGLVSDSVINLETLTTLAPREIAKKIGACDLLDFDPPLRVLLGL
jgi:mRNA interferase MazF